MPTSKLLPLLAMLLAAPLLPATAIAGTPLPDGPHIVVSGEGKIVAPPDHARVRFDFEQRAAQPLTAKQGVDSAVNRLLAGLTAFQVADADVSASSLRTHEDVEFGEGGRRVSNGFVATRTVTVVLRSVDRLNDFLDNGLASGAHRIAGIEFESARADVLRAEARREAVASARRRGAEMAAAFGAGLGPVFSIDSANSRYDQVYAARALDRIEVTGSRLPGGRYLQPTIEFSERVSAVFELRR